ncbi:MAG: tetratricopeptide repeat protein [Alphaproteobacteria bacterium]|nr:tetratricopeptide repeat protein [Alphaproteobacteria bacterium]
MAETAERLKEAQRLLQAGRLDEAAARFRALASEHPGDATFPYLLGVAARAAGRLDEAIDHLEAARALSPGDVHILNLLAGSRQRAGDGSAANALYAAVLDIDPDNGEALSRRGDICFDGQDMAGAAILYRRAIAAGEASPPIATRYGVALVQTGNAEAAIPVLEDAAAKAPDNANTILALAEARSILSDTEAALALARRAVALFPDRIGVRMNAAKILRAQNRFTEAVDNLSYAADLRPDDAEIRGRLGLALLGQGRVGDALREFDAGRKIDPVGSAARNRLLALHYAPDLTPATIAAAHLDWGRRVEASVATLPARGGAGRDPDRRLRIGYLSADLRRHSVGYFIEPILRHHDRDAIEPVVLSMVLRPDKVSERLRGYCASWHSVAGMTDDDCAALVRDLRIDVLVDLAGHTGGGRLDVLARRPAPVQVTYLGYPDTTGLTTVDYRVTDAVADPPGADGLYSERLVRLPHCFLCYGPDADSPAVAAAPDAANGYVTFGSFNNIAKLSDAALAAWARILGESGDSRLLLKTLGLADDAVRARLVDRLAAAGVPPDRLIIRPPVAGFGAHLETYAEVDIALDTFPYCGTTTTCEALWMGVPVVSRVGDSHVARVGASLLAAAGLADLAAASTDSYVETAVALADDRRRRHELRRGLRPDLQASPLLDGAGFTRRLEAAYRGMWHANCAATPDPGR